MGVVIDGCPPRLALSEEDIQPELDRRRPGQSDIVTPRKEEDTCQILSGVFHEIPTPGPKLTGRWKPHSGRPMPTLPIRRSMAFATGRAVGAHRREKPSDGSQPVRWQKRF